VVFGWVFASHQVGAAIAAFLAGLVRDKLGNYNLAWFVAGGLCIAASVMCLAVRRIKPAQPEYAPMN
ncbi:MAG: MFS transporter, partial [Actinomycetota bacterium]|nr:MFS transporter [Actinomycetota bacterium]